METTSSTSAKVERKDVTHVLEEKGDLRRDLDELLVPEVVPGVPEKLDERDKGSPRVRTVHQKPLQQDPRDDFSELIGLNLMEQVQNEGAEPVGVRVGVTQVQNHSTEQVVLT